MNSKKRSKRQSLGMSKSSLKVELDSLSSRSPHARFSFVGGLTQAPKQAIIPHIDRVYSVPLKPAKQQQLTPLNSNNNNTNNKAGHFKSLFKLLDELDNLDVELETMRGTGEFVDVAGHIAAVRAMEPDVAAEPPVSRIGKRLEEIRKIAEHYNSLPKEPVLPTKCLDFIEITDVTLGPLDISAKFQNISGWQYDGASADPDTNDQYIQVIQNILIREAHVIKLHELCEQLDDQYFKYSVMRIVCHERQKPPNSERLVAKRKTIRELQTKVTTTIAHLRGVTIELLESITVWRASIQAAFQCPDDTTVSFFYKGENYLMRMRNDLGEFSRYQTLRLWVGYSFNAVLTPPNNNNSSSCSSNSNNNNNYNSSNHVFDMDKHVKLKRELYDDWLHKRREAPIVVGKIYKADRQRSRSNSQHSYSKDGDSNNNITVESSFRLYTSVTTTKPSVSEAFQGLFHEDYSEVQISVHQLNSEAISETNIGVDSEGNMTIAALDDAQATTGNSEFPNEIIAADETPAVDTVYMPEIASAETIGVSNENLQKIASIDVIPELLAELVSYTQVSEKANINSDLSHHENAEVTINATEKDAIVVSEDTLFMPDERSVASSESRYGTLTAISRSDEWDMLREYLWSSWGDISPFTTSSTGFPAVHYVQGPKVSPTFWENMEHHPLAVEAAVGFSEVWPIVPLVPPLPSTLLNRANTAWQVIKDEATRQAALSELRQRHLQDQEQERILEQVKEQELEQLLLSGSHSTGTHAALRWNQHKKQRELLKERQMQPSLTTANLNNSVSSRIINTKDNDSVNDIFEMTAASVSATSITANFHTLPLKSTTSALTINPEKLQSQVEAKIRHSQSLTSIDANTFVRKMNPALQGKGRRLPDLQTGWYLRLCAHRIVTVVAKFCYRKRKASALRNRHRNKAAVCIQKIVRGRIGRRLYFAMRKTLRLRTIMLRKYYVRRFRSALVITKFIRRVAEARQASRDGVNDGSRNKLHAMSKRTQRRFRQLLTDEEIPGILGPQPQQRRGNSRAGLSSPVSTSRGLLDEGSVAFSLASHQSSSDTVVNNSSNNVLFFDDTEMSPNHAKNGTNHGTTTSFMPQYSRTQSKLLPLPKERGKTLRYFAARTKDRSFISDGPQFSPPKPLASHSDMYVTPMEQCKMVATVRSRETDVAKALVSEERLRASLTKLFTGLGDA